MKIKISIAILVTLVVAIYFLRPIDPTPSVQIKEPLTQEAEPIIKSTLVVEQVALASQEEKITEKTSQYHSEPTSPLVMGQATPREPREKSKAEQFLSDYSKERARDSGFKMHNERMLTQEIIKGPFNHKGSGLSRLAIECKSKTCVLTGKSRYPIHDDILVQDLQRLLEPQGVRVEQIDYNRSNDSFIIALYPENP